MPRCTSSNAPTRLTDCDDLGRQGGIVYDHATAEGFSGRTTSTTASPAATPLPAGRTRLRAREEAARTLGQSWPARL